MLLLPAISLHKYLYSSGYAKFLEISQAFLTYAKVNEVINITICSVFSSPGFFFSPSLLFMLSYEKNSWLISQPEL